MAIHLENWIKFFYFQFSNKLFFSTVSVSTTGWVGLLEASGEFCSETGESPCPSRELAGLQHPGLSLCKFNSLSECSPHHPEICWDWHSVGLPDVQWILFTSYGLAILRGRGRIPSLLPFLLLLGGALGQGEKNGAVNSSLAGLCSETFLSQRKAQ